ncbi:MAG TPA: transaldolase family protein [Candidatus Dormibacteraeota bacterium]|nr:transaldolase family protein [Candidatus Dormibacteraeota bacterium]
MKPNGLKTRIFLDSGDPAETKRIISLLGFLDGQTTNPTLVAKNPYAKERFERGEKFSSLEIRDFYKQVVTEVSGLIPQGSVSVEVYADQSTTQEDMFAQGQEMYGWIPNAHIKYPTITAGLAAAEQSTQAGMRVNMTLCFSQEQAAAVYAATKGAPIGNVFVSPFVGRLDDLGENGMSLIDNIIKMYKGGDGHVEVLAASIRTMDHFMQSLALGADIITAPYAILEQWGKDGMPLPEQSYVYDQGTLKDISYQDVDLNKPWSDYDIAHELTTKGVERFSADWNALIS